MTYAERLGKTFSLIVAPLGFDDRVTVALIFGFAAKEIVISSLSISFNKDEGKSIPLGERLAKDGTLNTLSAISLLLFILLYVPCIATVSIFYHESQSAGWTVALIAGTTATAWIFSFIVYQGGRILGF